jgi:hypothetical protein
MAIPGAVLARYWDTTGGWSAFATRRYCQRLADPALISNYRQDPARVVLHGVIRAYLREKTQHRHDELHRALIEAHRSLVPPRRERLARGGSYPQNRHTCGRGCLPTCSVRDWRRSYARACTTLGGWSGS